MRSRTTVVWTAAFGAALAVGALAAGAVLRATPAATTVASDGDTDGSATGGGDTAHAHSHLPSYEERLAAATPAQRAAAVQLVAATKAATAKYADYDAGRAAGYRPNPNGGPNATHHPNPALMRDGKALDPSAPESLMYWTARDGSKVLVGAVYKTRPSENAPTPGGDLTMWHTHTASGSMCHPGVEAGCPQNTGKMLHVFFFPGARDPFAENMIAAAGGRQAFRTAMQRAAG